jgi:spermidine synthase
LRYPSVQEVVLVELDPAMTRLFATQPALVGLNQGALLSPRVRVVNADAFSWLQAGQEVFDVIVVDFPDPTNFSIGKLYSTSFYALLDQRLAASGFAVIQTTSPLVARQSFWTVVQTLEAVGLQAVPYHAHVPSFGEWGYVLASRRPWQVPVDAASRLPAGLRFLTADTLPQLLHFPADMARVPAGVQRLSNQVLVHTYEREWGKLVGH